MHKLSTGHDSTLGNYRILTAAFFGEDSPAVKFLDDKIAIDGADAEVIQDEGQMLYMLNTLHNGAP